MVQSGAGTKPGTLEAQVSLNVLIVQTLHPSLITCGAGGSCQIYMGFVHMGTLMLL